MKPRPHTHKKYEPRFHPLLHISYTMDCLTAPLGKDVFSAYLFIIIIIFLHGLGHLTCSGIDALPSFPGVSTISSPSRFVVEGMFGKSGVVCSFEMVDPVLFVFGFHILYSRDL
jgi:hypothetical protein